MLWNQHPSGKELYDSVLLISSTFTDKRLKFGGHQFKNKGELAEVTRKINFFGNLHME